MGKKKPNDQSKTPGQRSLAEAERWMAKQPSAPSRIAGSIYKQLAEKAGVAVHEAQAAVRIVREAAGDGRRGAQIREWVESVRSGELSATTVAYNYIPGMNASLDNDGCDVTRDSDGNIDLLRAILSGQVRVLTELARQEEGTWTGTVCTGLVEIINKAYDGAVRRAATGG